MLFSNITSIINGLIHWCFCRAIKFEVPRLLLKSLMKLHRWFSNLRRLMGLPKASLHGIVFDLDGTLTVPCLDFKKLKRQLKIDDNVDILGHVGTLSGKEKANAMAIIETFEADGRDKLELQPGINELFEFLRKETNLKLAILTRNDMHSVTHFFEKCKECEMSAVMTSAFSTILTRDFKPVKPDPAAVLHIASEWRIKPNNLLVIGDGECDIVCGKQAGSITLLVNNKNNTELKQLADLNVDSLLEIIPIIKSYLQEET